MTSMEGGATFLIMSAIKVLFCGDVTSTGRVRQYIEEGQFASLWNDTRTLLNEHDYCICNLECPIGPGGQPIEKIGPHLIGHSMLPRFLKQWGFDAVGLANNHIMDYGEAGLRNTLKACEAVGLGTFGAGVDLSQASAAHRVTIKGKTLSIVAAAEEEFCIASERVAGVPPLDPISLYRRIVEERKVADWVILFFHGGNEHYPLPRPGLQDLCRFCVDLGADAVVGNHPHIRGAYEIYKNKPIFYSLGNFLFDRLAKVGDSWWQGMMLSLSLRGGQQAIVSIHPYRQMNPTPGVVRIAGEAKVAALQEIETKRRLTEIPCKVRDEWANYASASSVRVVAPFVNLSRFPLLRKVMHGLVRSKIFPSRFWVISVLNRIRCASHRELFLEWAELQYWKERRK